MFLYKVDEKKLKKKFRANFSAINFPGQARDTSEKLTYIACRAYEMCKTCKHKRRSIIGIASMTELPEVDLPVWDK